jgi:hypothetical protein
VRYLFFIPAAQRRAAETACRDKFSVPVYTGDLQTHYMAAGEVDYRDTLTGAGIAHETYTYERTDREFSRTKMADTNRTRDGFSGRTR